MRRAASMALCAASALMLVACDDQIDDLSTHTSVAPPLGVTPTLVADPTRAEATEMAPEPQVEPKDIKVYVAMGDSYASMGSAVGDKADDSFCAQSEDNYPNELAKILGSDVDFIDAACQGSETSHIMGRRIVEHEDVDIEPQIEKLPRNADLVTVSLGGNDLGFADIARCVNAMMDGEDIDCADEHALNVAQKLAELPGKLTDVYGEIHKKAPNAVIVATGYMPLLSAEQPCELTDDVGRDGVQWAEWLTAAINNIVKQSIETSGGAYVLPDETEKHTTCAPPRKRWVAVDGEETGSYPAHPTPKGQEAMADAIATAIGR